MAVALIPIAASHHHELEKGSFSSGPHLIMQFRKKHRLTCFFPSEHPFNVGMVGLRGKDQQVVRLVVG